MYSLVGDAKFRLSVSRRCKYTFYIHQIRAYIVKSELCFIDFKTTTNFSFIRVRIKKNIITGIRY